MSGCSNTGNYHRDNVWVQIKHEAVVMFICLHDPTTFSSTCEFSHWLEVNRIKDSSLPLGTWLKPAAEQISFSGRPQHRTDLITADTKSAETRWGFNSALHSNAYFASLACFPYKTRAKTGDERWSDDGKQKAGGGMQRAEAADEPHRCLPAKCWSCGWNMNKASYIWVENTNNNRKKYTNTNTGRWLLLWVEVRSRSEHLCWI